MVFRSLVELLRTRARRQPDRLAYSFFADSDSSQVDISYSELDARARAIAATLQQQNLSPGDRALLLYPPGLEFIAGFFGCLYAGVIAVPAYPPQPSGKDRSLYRLKSIARDAQPVAALTVSQQSAIGKVVAGTEEFRGVNVLATDAIELAQADQWREPAIDEGALAFLQYTSGSTGSPKGVMVTHGNLLCNCAVMQECLELSENTISVTWLPHFHDMGLIEGLLNPVHAGYPTILMPSAQFVARPIQWLQLISRFRATHSGAPNFAYDLCVRKVRPEQRAELDLSSWTLAYSGAEPVRHETLERFAEFFASCGFQWRSLSPGYGLAEATLVVSFTPKSKELMAKDVDVTQLERGLIAPPSEGKSRRLVGCGPVPSATQVSIVDPETLKTCPQGAVGEIWVSGPTVARGYWGLPEKSADTFNAFTADQKAGPFLRTGDLGFTLGDELFVTGRLKDLIIIRGMNHYPQDIENTAGQCHAALRTAASAAFSIEIDGQEKLVLVQELERQYIKSNPEQLDQIVQAVRSAVSDQHELELYALRLLKPASIPKTSSGKIQRHACRDRFLNDGFESVAEWTQQAEIDAAPDVRIEVGEHDRKSIDAIRQWLITRLSRRLKVRPETIDPRMPFSRHGVDSLGAINLAVELEEWLARRLSPTLAWEYPDIESLSRHLAGESVPSNITYRQKMETAEESIAIIGIGCRFPHADGPDAFWQLLRTGADVIGEVPRNRWDIDAYYDPDANAPGKMNTRSGGFLDGIDQFDAQFFGITPREAARMDPQQRLLLEVVWEALDDGGQAPQQLAESRTGVFIGISTNDYGRRQLEDPRLSDTYAGTGGALSIAANRISYFLNLRGPSMAVDTACSSSLVAVHLACCSLWRGESTMAVAGGVNLTISPLVTVNLTKGGFLSPDGQCKAFDAEANGYVRGEGVGAVVLKPLSRAIADGDPVYAVIRGSAVNQDGRSNGITAPSPQAQEAVLEEAYRQAGIPPGLVQYVEAHGTGTLLGDPIEAAALASVLAQGRPEGQFCALGSVKTNIGHLEAAAGIAGLIKAALALKHREIPPSLHFNAPNPHIPFSQIPLRVQQNAGPWPHPDQRLIAGVSSFGFGGTNAHVVVEEMAPSVERPKRTERLDRLPGGRAELLTLSAHTSEALKALAASYDRALAPEGVLSRSEVYDICFTAAVRRSHHEHRLSIVAKTREEIGQGLRSFLNGETSGSISSGGAVFGQQPKIAFVFSGQGQQYWGMGRELMEHELVFRQAIEQCDELIRRHATWSLIEELAADDSHSRLAATDVAQPALFSIQIALVRLLRSWGIVPSAVIGHSMGEVAAACVAESLSLEDAVRLIVLRGHLMQQAAGHGKMASVELSAEDADNSIALYRDRLVVAACNGLVSTVLSGETAALNEVLQALGQKGVFCRLIQGEIAFHSPQMLDLSEELKRGLADLQGRPSRVPMYSTVTGRSGDDVSSADYWARNAREPVRFAAAAARMIEDGFTVLLELSPHPVLSAPLTQSPAAKDKKAVVLASMYRGRSERETILKAAGALYVNGYPVDWKGVFAESAPVLPLPPYPWQRERFWIDDGRLGGVAEAVTRLAQDTSPPASAEKNSEGDLYDWVWRRKARTAAPMDYQLSAPDSVSRGNLWLVFADEGGVAEQLARRLSSQGHTCKLIFRGEEFEASGRQYRIRPTEQEDLTRVLRSVRSSDGSWCRGIVHLWSLDTPQRSDIGVSELEQTQSCTLESVLGIVQCLTGLGTTEFPQLWLVTRGAQSVQERSESVSIAQAPLWGLGRVIAGEHPELWKGLIDLDPNNPAAISAEHLTAEILKSDGEDLLAYREGNRHVARLARIKSDGATEERLRFRPDAAYLITGGLGDTGLFAARWMAERGARRLILMDEDQLPARHEWLHVEPGTLLARQIASVRALENLGASVHAVHADVADELQVKSFLSNYERECWPAIRGVAHTAGVMPTGALVDLNPSGLRLALRSRISGAWILDRLLRDNPLEFFILFSSGSILPEQNFHAASAAANAFMTALAHHRHARGRSALALDWSLSGETAADDGAAALSLLPEQGVDDTESFPVPAPGASVLTERERENVSPYARAAASLEAQRAAGVFEFAWKHIPPPVPTPVSDDAAKGGWLVFADRSGVGEALADRLKNLGHMCISVSYGHAYQRFDGPRFNVCPSLRGDFNRLLADAFVNSGLACRGVIHLWAVDSTPPEQTTSQSLKDDHELGCASLLCLVQALSETELKGRPRLWIVTSGAQPVDEADMPSVPQGSLWGLARTIAVEQTSLKPTLVDLDAGMPGRTSARFLANTIFAKDGEDQVAWRGGKRFAARLWRRPEASTQAPSWNSDASYILTGGLGALGMQVAMRMVDAGVRDLVLIQRSKLPPRAAWDNLQQENPLANAIAFVRKLEAKGARVHVFSADITREDQVAVVFSEIRTSLPPLRGIIHAAGILDDGILSQMSPARFENVMAPKITGAWNLHSLTLNDSLDFFVCFSSLASLLGSPGRANYAAANAGLDAFVHYRQRLSLPALSINWGPWAEVGMAAADARRDERLAQQGIGIGSIAPVQAVRLLEQLLQQEIPQLAVAVFDVGRLKESALAGNKPLFKDLLSRPVGVAASEKVPEQTAVRGVESVSPMDAMKVLDRLLARNIAQAVLLPMNWNELWRSQPRASESGLFSELFSAQETEQRVQKRKLTRKTLSAAAAGERRSLLGDYLRGQVARVTGLSEVNLVAEQPLVKFGVDSLMAVELKDRVEVDLGLSMPLVTFLSGASIVQLVEKLLEAIGPEDSRSHEPQMLQASHQEDGARVPLSHSQRWFWCLQELNPESPWCNVATIFRLAGTLDRHALESSLNEIVRRHDALRMSFPVFDGETVQLVSPGLTVHLEVSDISNLDASRREEEARRLAIEESYRPFDLANGPLIRSMLLRLGENDHFWVMTAHHSVTDEWSREILMRELETLYRAFSAGEPTPFPKLPPQYVDFDAWQRHWLAGAEPEAQLSYWKRQLEGVPVLDFPADHPRMAQQTYEGRVEHRELRNVSEALKELSRRESCTLHMTLMAAFKALLCRYTGQEDIAVGSFVMTRTRPESKGLIGCLVNSVVFRTRLTGNPTFRELLNRVREMSLAAYSHQDVPFEMLLDALQVRRDSARTPLFQAAFSYDRILQLDLPGVTATYLYLDHARSNFDFTLRIRENADGLAAVMEYNARLFESVTMQRLLAAYETLLQGIAADPDRTISDLPLLSESERRQMLGEWDDTQEQVAAVSAPSNSATSEGDIESIALEKLKSMRRKRPLKV